MSQRLRIATFGDSTANVGRIHDSTAVPITAVTATATDSVGIEEAAVWALPVHFPMAQLVGNFGIDGNDTQRMLAPDRVAPYTLQPMSIQALINAAPDLVVLRGGSINDLQGANPSNVAGLVATCIDNHREILRRMVVDGGLKVLDCGIFGYGDGSLATSGSAGTVRSALLQVNAALAAMAAEFGNSVRYVSPLNTLHDGNGRFIPGMTVDGLHLSLAGGLAQARLEADALTAWLGASTGNAYPGTNLMFNAGMQTTTGPGVTPVGYVATGWNAAIDNQRVESIGGKTFYTVRAGLPSASSAVLMYLPFDLRAFGAGEVIGCEFDFFYERQSGSTPRFVEFAARQDYVWSGNRVTHYAEFSARESSAATGSLNGRIVFLPFRLPAGGGAYDPNQSQLLLHLGFGTSGSSELKVGIGNPRLVRV